jgi:hypothetical protein
MVSTDQHQGEYLIHWFPGVVSVWVSLPFDKVLQGLAPPVQPVIDDGLYFVLCLSFDQLGWCYEPKLWNLKSWTT